MPGAKYWMYTINNPHNEDQPKEWQNVVQYTIWQVEMGENGTLHLQGYLVLKKAQTLEYLKKHFDNGAHWEIRRGTHIQAKEYCSKEDTKVLGPFELGDDSKVPTGQGQRSDLLAVKKAIDEGKDEIYLVDEHFGTCAKHMRFFRDYKRIKSAQRNWKTEVWVIWGKTGTGKSRYCAEHYPNAYWKPQSNWWDGYTGQEVVVIDEFYGWLSYSFMLRLLDRYPLVLETKGGHTTFLAKKIIITSNKEPKDWFDPVRNAFAPLERRIDKVLNFPADQFFDLGLEDLVTLDDIGVSTTTTTSTTTTSTSASAVPTPLACDETLSPSVIIIDKGKSPEVKRKRDEWDTDSDEEIIYKGFKPPAKAYPRTGTHLDHSWQSPCVSPPPSPCITQRDPLTIKTIHMLYEEAEEERNI